MQPQSIATLQKAAALFGEGRLKEAEKFCRRVLKAEPKAVDALNLLSLIHKQSGDLKQAEKLMRDCLSHAPERADIRANLGNLLVSSSRLDEAEKAYRSAIQTAPQFRPARLGLARLLNQVGNGAAASAEARTLIGHNRKDAEAWNVLGMASNSLGLSDAAEDAYRMALKLQPNYAAARHNLGAFLAGQSRNEESLEELDKAAAAGITGAEISHNRAASLMALGQFDEAESLLVRTLADIPPAVSLQSLLARIRYMRGSEEFAAGFAAALEAEPGNVDLRLGYSQVMRGAELLDASLAIMEQGLSIDDSDVRLLAEMSAALHDAGRYEEALVFARRAAAIDPADVQLKGLLIQAHLSLGHADKAMPLILEARQRAPLDQLYIALEATAARLLGDPRYEALYDYERLVQPFKLPVPEGWDTIEAFHRDLIPVLTERHQFSAPPLDQSLRAGTQTPRGLLGDPSPVIKAFLKALEGPIATYRERMGYDPEHPLSARNEGPTKLIGCWSVRLHREGFHVNHVHSEGWISSAYYVQVPPEVTDTKAQSGWIKFGEPKFHVPGATPEKVVQPAAGTLVLFPSYMWHGTTPILGNDARMTIAFDVVPVSNAQA